MLEFEDLACIPVSVSKQPLVLFQYLSHFSSSRLRSFDGTLASILTITNFFLGRTNILRTLIPTCVIRKRKWKKIYKKKKIFQISRQITGRTNLYIFPLKKSLFPPRVPRNYRSNFAAFRVPHSTSPATILRTHETTGITKSRRERDK